MWHVVPSMKSHVALNPVTWPFSMHLPPLFVIHKLPDFRLVWWFLGYMLILILHFHFFHFSINLFYSF
jgi:hypothetical protein